MDQLQQLRSRLLGHCQRRLQPLQFVEFARIVLQHKLRLLELLTRIYCGYYCWRVLRFFP